MNLFFTFSLFLLCSVLKLTSFKVIKFKPFFQLGGVCGNFNNILSDDFVIDGKPTDDIENFMISNQVGKCGSIPLPPINDCPNDLFQR